MASHNINFKTPLKEIPTVEIIRTRNGPLHSGGFSDIWKCTWSASSGNPSNTVVIEVAIKVVRVPDVTQEELLKKTAWGIRREAHVWIGLEDDHVLSLHRITTDFGVLPAFVSPWMEKGSLHSLLELKPILSTSKKLDMSRQIASGLKYLHEKGIVHGDLTPTNVLINSNDKLCLADFGLSVILAESSNSTFNSCHAGNVRWMAPEMFDLPDPEGEPIKPRMPGDVYSHGCIMLQLLCGQKPYCRLENVLHVTTAINRRIEPFPQLSGVDEGHKQYLLTCLSTKFDARPKVQEIVAFIETELQKKLDN